MAQSSTMVKRRRGFANSLPSLSRMLPTLQALLAVAVFGIVLFFTMQQFAHTVKKNKSADEPVHQSALSPLAKISHAHELPPPGISLPSSSSFSASVASLLSNIPSFSSLSDSLSSSSSIGDKSATLLNVFTARVKNLLTQLHEKNNSAHQFVELFLQIFIKLKAINADDTITEKDKREIIEMSLNELIGLCMENVNEFKGRNAKRSEGKQQTVMEGLRRRVEIGQNQEESSGSDSSNEKDEDGHSHHIPHAAHHDDHQNEADLVPELIKDGKLIQILNIEVPANYSYSPPVDVSGEATPEGLSELNAGEVMNLTVCHYVRSQYDVHPKHDWGRLPKSMQPKWAQLRCDPILAKEDLLIREKFKAMSKRIRKREEHITPQVPDNKANLPIVAICICTTTRGLYEIRSLDDLTLFSQLLPSLVEYAEPEFHYRIYLLYDIGDLYFDQNGREQQVREWFEQHVQAKLARKDITATVSILYFENKERKPGPAFNHVLRTAYDDGANWLYRINDDTVFETTFTSSFVRTLNHFGVPYGAVGPTCKTGNTMILTHDFTHRTHLDIFYPYYYPAVLSDWWMDDWISRVYGRKRTKRNRDVIVKHFSKEGTRYEVNMTHGTLLDVELDRGRSQIIDWMKNNNVEASVIKTFSHDEFKFKVTNG